MENTMNGPVQKIAWAFGSEPRKNLALMAYALAKRPAWEKTRTMLTMVIGYSLFATILRTAWRDLKDPEDTGVFDAKFWNPTRLALMMTTDHFNGIPFIGETATRALNQSFGIYNQSGDLLSGATGGVAAARHLPDIISGKRGADRSIKDFQAMFQSLGYLDANLAAASTFTGLATQIYGAGENAFKTINPPEK